MAIPLRGRIDHYDPAARRLLDFKTSGDMETQFDPHRKRRVPKLLPTPEHAAQANLYALLLAEHGLPVTEALIWYVEPHHRAPRRLVKVELMDRLDAYDLAYDLAYPLAQARVTGELPDCTCRYRPKEPDLDLCASTRGWRGLSDERSAA